MSAVIFLRHAKSDWHAGASNDIERPLNKRGRQAAAAVGIFLAESGHVPDLVLCSPATRTRQTLELAMEAGGWTSPTETADELYYGSVNHMIALACQRRAPVTMLVGHEPTTSTAIGRLTGAELRMPTATLARVSLNPDNTGQLDWLIPPRLLTDR
ncbi:MAG: histidine phosphatase family protein [Acidimicrobiia bacterium]|nr:histidine phosphatase family protein [Acidimicrobiia bacterium]MYE71728.1 histidine phosphatase family protein [Acidimicrobiia bacterium]MYJ62349.1 histidine phosphatase family protein [Acidimicrobiia bacterium]